ncbi:MAG: Gldg family protein [Treponema sp.]|uniref:GldG family protein n=1 Tax=Treponema sp. TaxID=166 RepID=UPI0025DEA225|nr:Gldg family protein [Treponema sp.]MBR0495974.1 Gldg family protein [Treponema sp.]
MKKFINYLKSPKSDFFLFVLLLIFANLVVSRSYFRIDLTSPKSYSLSKGSEQVVKTLEEPLSVKVFFSDNLNAPYSSVYQYIKDILVEYKSAANDNFSYEFVDMKKPENERLASTYGLNQIQIQELKNNEVGMKRVWMGIVLLYADRIETLDALTSTDGLEYRITTTISNMVSTTSALSGLSGEVKLTLYASKKLADFKIIGFSQMEDEIRSALAEVNKKNKNRISFASIDPAPAEIPELVEKYGIQSLNWNDPNLGSGTGAVGLVLEYGEKATLFPVKMSRDFFGRNMITGLEDLNVQIEESLKSIVSKSQEIGYITGHGELELEGQSQYGQPTQSVFAKLLSDRYTLKEIKLSEEEIPQKYASVIINGPKSSFTDEELYKIDQYVLKGGNLLVFVDPFEEKQSNPYSQPTYEPVNTGLEKNLEKFGVAVGKKYVYDLNCFSQTDRQYGKMNFYIAPMMQKNTLEQKNPITKNLGYVIFFQNAPLDISAAKKNSNAKVTVLAKSSKESWTVDSNISPDPRFISVPSDKSTMASENLAVLVEGKFSSAFSGKPESKTAEGENVEKKAEADNAQSSISSNEHLSKSVQNSKIIVIGSSILGGATIPMFNNAQLLDAEGNQPVSMFIRNAVDYLNGEEDLCTMRTKGLSLNTLTVKSVAASTVAKYFNEIGLVVIVAVCGLLVLLKIKAKKRAIRERYNPNDSRIEK